MNVSFGCGWWSGDNRITTKISVLCYQTSFKYYVLGLMTKIYAMVVYTKIGVNLKGHGHIFKVTNDIKEVIFRFIL